MEKKTKTYLLLGAVLVIWGIIGYKIISTISPKPLPQTKASFDVAFKPKQHIEADTFSIQLVHRDPFLGTLSKKKKPLLQKKSKPKTSWVSVLYHGSIAQTSGKTKVFIVTIDNTQVLMKKGQTVSGVTLLKGSDTRVVMSFKGELKAITKT